MYFFCVLYYIKCDFIKITVFRTKQICLQILFFLETIIFLGIRLSSSVFYTEGYRVVYNLVVKMVTLVIECPLT